MGDKGVVAALTAGDESVLGLDAEDLTARRSSGAPWSPSSI